MDTWENNGVEAIIFDIKWLNETNIEEQLGYSNLRHIMLQYPKYLRKQRKELQNFVINSLVKKF